MLGNSGSENVAKLVAQEQAWDYAQLWNHSLRGETLALCN